MLLRYSHRPFDRPIKPDESPRSVRVNVLIYGESLATAEASEYLAIKVQTETNDFHEGCQIEPRCTGRKRRSGISMRLFLRGGELRR